MEGIRRRLNSIELEFGISLKGKKLSLDIKKKRCEKSRGMKMNHGHVKGRRKLNANFRQLREPNSDDWINLDALLPRQINFNRCNSRSFNTFPRHQNFHFLLE